MEEENHVLNEDDFKIRFYVSDRKLSNNTYSLANIKLEDCQEKNEFLAKKIYLYVIF